MRGVTTGGEAWGRWETPERRGDLGRIADALERIAALMEREALDGERVKRMLEAEFSKQEAGE